MPSCRATHPPHRDHLAPILDAPLVKFCWRRILAVSVRNVLYGVKFPISDTTTAFAIVFKRQSVKITLPVFHH